MASQTPQPMPMPTPPPLYEKTYEDERNRQIDINFTQQAARKAIMGTTINLNRLPTSATGLRSGDVWSDSGTLKIVP